MLEASSSKNPIDELNKRLKGKIFRGIRLHLVGDTLSLDFEDGTVVDFSTLGGVEIEGAYKGKNDECRNLDGK